jgi:hypothetical protein
MAIEPSRQPPEQDSDYDGAWKEALRLHLQEFIEKYFPAEYAAIDWSCEPEWFDKELSLILAQSGQRNREVDVVVKVRLLDGNEQWILVHLEVQTSYEPNFTTRIARYNAGLTWSFGQRVVTLVVLADLRRGWLPDEDVFRVGTFQSRLTFPVCKLLERLDDDWKNDQSLPVLLARAQIEAPRTSSDPDGRYQAKSSLVRGLYELGYNAEKIRGIFRLIDWMMHLRIDLERRFRDELSEFEEAKRMPYVTSIERLAEARMVLRQLSEICGSLPVDVRDRVHAMPSEQLELLGSDLLRFHSIIDLQHWLDQHAAPDE